MIGERVGNFVVLGEIGRGGMSTVFEASHVEFGLRAALKVLNPEYAERPELLRRFLNEGRAVSRLRHPGVVRIHDCGQLPDGRAYIIMEYLEGGSLRKRMEERGRLSEAEVLRLGRQIASTLASVHAQHIIHRDLKPDNIIVVPDAEVVSGERAKILDFGIAKLAQGSEGESAAPLATQIGTIMGTPAYMAPEQCQESRSVDGKADVYSLGIVLYQMLSGQAPFVGPAVVIMSGHLLLPPRPLLELLPTLSKALAALVMRMLSKLPELRPSMAEVAAQLDELAGEGARLILPGSSGPNSSRPGTPEPQPRLGPSTWPGGLARRGVWGTILTASLALGAVVVLLSRGAPRSLGGTPGLDSAAPADLAAPRELADLRVAAAPASPDLASGRLPALSEATPRRRLVVILTDPAGAEVVRRRDGRVLGRTPLTLDSSAAGSSEPLLLRKAGYHEKAIEVDFSRSERKSFDLLPSVL